jgi:hypothetical protein
MDENDKPQKWSLTITKVVNGFIVDGLNDYGKPDSSVIEEDDVDEFKAGEELLWFIMEYFNFQGSKHGAPRLRITREGRDD